MRKKITYGIVMALVAMVFVTVPMCASSEDPPPEPTEPPIPDWIVEGTGTHFEITSSEFPNVALTSSETVTVWLESTSGIVNYHLQSDSTATTTEITLSGLEPSTTYSWYQDGELQGEFTTDATGSYTYSQDLSVHDILINEKPNVSSSSGSMSLSFAGGSGTATDPYQISTVEQLQDMKNDLDAHYILVNDIDASATSGWNGGAGFEPIAPLSGIVFTGTFDGNDYKITDLYINRPSASYIGLFGYSDTGEIKNVALENIEVTGNSDVGSLVGRNFGSISNSYATGFVSSTGGSWVMYNGGLVGRNIGSISNSYATCSVSSGSGYWYVGGLVGENRGSISNCFATGSVSSVKWGYRVGGLVGENRGLISNSYATGSISGSFYAGGLVGRNYGSISNSYATGSISGCYYVGGLVGQNFASISNSYAIGSVSGSNHFGGLVKHNYGGIVSYSFWDTVTSGTTWSAVGTGKTTTEMMQQTTFIGWDFNSIWDIDEGVTYPFHRPPNAPPEIQSINQVDPVAVDTIMSITGTFSDPDDGDTHTAMWSWGYETDDTPGTVDQDADTVTGTHPYPSPGIYAVTLTVTDEAGESATMDYQYVVVYDPSGGFVTGGGWIDSPAGAYIAEETSSGKANFGFVSKYKKGTTVPEGNTQFQFKAGGMNFHSDTYQWLVIAGARAQFKGIGTINGDGEYGFMLSAVDGAINGGGGTDKFRIKIWDISNEDAVVYDNQSGAEDTDPTTTLGGGSIVIHKAK